MPVEAQPPPNAHYPFPYALNPAGGGVRCRCGEDFSIGSSYPFSGKHGIRTNRKLKSLHHCWDAYHAHLADGGRPGEVGICRHCGDPADRQPDGSWLHRNRAKVCTDHATGMPGKTVVSVT
jgi:hypothetical protein